LRGAFAVASLEKAVMGALSERLALGVSPREVGRDRAAVEILGLKGGLAVGDFKQAMRVCPRPLLE
jgi:hypothetical protein